MTKIPKSLYVTFSERYDFGGDDKSQKVKIGFLHPYDASVRGKKRIETQNKWAYGISTPLSKDGAFFTTKSRWVRPEGLFPDKGYGHYEYYEVPIPPDLYPAIWENEPLEGFKVFGFNTRWSTSNKLIQVLDPRGALFEVTIKNFVDLMMKTTIVNGEIQGKLVWVKNKDLALA